MIVFLCLLAIIAPIVIVTPLQDSVVLPKLATTATFTGGALVWGAVLIVRDRWPAGRWPATLWAPVLIFVLINVLATAFAVDWRWSLVGEQLRYQGLATTLLYVLLFAVAAVTVRTTRDLRWLLLALFLGALGAAIYALIQKAGLDWVEWSGRSLDRPAATLGQANTFGAFLVAAISASAFLVVTARQRWQQAALGAGVLAMLFALFFTISRSAYIAAFVMLIIWSAGGVLWFVFLRHGRRPSTAQWAATGVAGAGVATLVLALAGVVATLALVLFPQGRAGLVDAADRLRASDEITSESIGGRLSLWRMALEMTADRPLLGHGQDAFTIRFAEYRDRPDLPGIRTDNVEPESAHNFFLDLASGTGVLGLLAFLTLVGALFWHATRRALAAEDEEVQVALLALGAGVVGYLVAIFFGFSEAMTSWLLWLLLGAMAGLLARVPPAGPPAERSERGSSALASGVAAIVLVLVGAIALGWAATLTAADLAAEQGLAGRAVTLNPLRKNYLAQKAQALERTASRSDDQAATLREAIDTFETLLRRFKPDNDDVLALAITRFELAQVEDAPLDLAIEDFERAIALDPFNYLLKSFVADFYDRQGLDDLALKHRLEIYFWIRPMEPGGP